MSATGIQLGTTRWQADTVAGALQPDPVTLDWLTESGLLTRRLRARCGAGFAMRVLRDAAGDATAGVHREVLLCCRELPCIYAVTDVPATTLREHGWLATLGGEPLGEALQNRADVTRSDFEFALLDGDGLPGETHAAGRQVWARRSDFLIGPAALTVTEVFLPGLGHCSPR